MLAMKNALMMPAIAAPKKITLAVPRHETPADDRSAGEGKKMMMNPKRLFLRVNADSGEMVLTYEPRGGKILRVRNFTSEVMLCLRAELGGAEEGFVERAVKIGGEEFFMHTLKRVSREEYEAHKGEALKL